MTLIKHCGGFQSPVVTVFCVVYLTAPSLALVAFDDESAGGRRMVSDGKVEREVNEMGLVAYDGLLFCTKNSLSSYKLARAYHP